MTTRPNWLDPYLARLGVADPGTPSLAVLTALHQAHVERIAYENIDIQLGRPQSIDPAESIRRVLAGRGGYCFNLNGAFSALLIALGYKVTRHRGGVHGVASTPRPDEYGNHMAVTVDLDGEIWMVDAGLGNAHYEPMRLVEGEHRQGPFAFRLERIESTPADPGDAITSSAVPTRTAVPANATAVPAETTASADATAFANTASADLASADAESADTATANSIASASTAAAADTSASTRTAAPDATSTSAHMAVPGATTTSTGTTAPDATAASASTTAPIGTTALAAAATSARTTAPAGTAASARMAVPDAAIASARPAVSDARAASARTTASAERWRFVQDTALGTGSFFAMDFTLAPAQWTDFSAHHTELSTAPTSPFVRSAQVYRRDARGTDYIVGCALHRVEGLDRHAERELATADEWFDAATDLFGLNLTQISADDRKRMWKRMRLAHTQWLATQAAPASQTAPAGSTTSLRDHIF